MSLRPIAEIAQSLGLQEDEYEHRGRHVVKVDLAALARRQDDKDGHLVLVTALTPTAAGEGKTVTSIGLTQGFARLGLRAMVTLRQPSLGPVFGVKGSAVGGGRSEVLPRELISLHFTGDMHAIAAAHNLLAALLDNHLMRDMEPKIDPNRVVFPRTVDMNDRTLRAVLLAHDNESNGVERPGQFVITAASEVMAVLCLAEGYPDLKRRLGDIIVAFTPEGAPIVARDLKAEGAMAALLRDAMMPNLVQTTEGAPALIHGGPFANIAHGTNSIIAARLARKLVDYTVIEAGFGSDLGAEKFLDIVAPQFGLAPDAVVIVATVRALKRHGGAIMRKLETPSLRKLRRGLPNLHKHVENLRAFGIPVVVAVNHHPADTESELNAVLKACEEWGVHAAISDAYAKGGDGATELARTVVQAIKTGETHYKPLYDYELDPFEKIERLARRIYGADGVEYSDEARSQLRRYIDLGYGNLPICVAKTQHSLSDDPKLRGVPTGWKLRVREVELRAGARFLVVVSGAVMLMPGLPREPRAWDTDVDPDGTIHLPL